MEKAKGETGRRQILLESITETKRENVRNDKTLTEEEKTKKLNEIQAKYDNDLEFYVFQGGDVSDYFKLGSQAELLKSANRAAKKAIKGATDKDGKPITPDHPDYNTTLSKLQAEYLATLTKQFGKQFADGGAVTEDVNIMTETPTSMTDVNVEETVNPEQLSYDELRARLPKEIGDDIVTLLANSYEALGDFAQIRTQTDVDQFNQKYQVQLVLPQEA
jgi:membrane-associated HD superfamily phosphohydrolase